MRLGSAHSLELAVAHLGGWHPVVAVLVAVAALARCAQGMFRRWLSLTVSAPTPACALLHAGVVNGGGVLLVRLGVIGEWTPAMAGLLVVSGATAVWASLVAARQADVKGQLASSTMAQMGFMLAECAVGAYPAAVVHLVGHGSYKASLFLSSGSPVARRGQAAPAATAGPWWAPVTVGAVTSMVAAAAVVPGVALGDGVVLAVLAAGTAGSLAWALRKALSGPGGWRWAALLVVGAGCYGMVVGGLGRFLAAGLPAAEGTLSPWWLAGLAAVALLSSWFANRSRLAPRLQTRLLDSATAPPGWQRPRAPRGKTLLGVVAPSSRLSEASPA